MTEQQKKQSSVEAAMQDRLVKAAWLGLEALNEVTGWQWAGPMRVMDEVEDAITALTAALEQPAQQEIDWKDQYEKQKRRADMWVAKYEADIGQLEKAGPVTAQQEPVAHFGSAYVNENGVHITTVLGPVAIPQDAKLYTRPPAREWVGLTAGDISLLWKRHTSEDGPYHNPYDDDGLGFARSIEAKLREKNT